MIPLDFKNISGLITTVQAGKYLNCSEISRDEALTDSDDNPDNTDRYDVNKLIIELLETEIE